MANLVIRAQIASGREYSRYREQLRVDFWFSCAYCTITELEASGIGFCIDHYEPQVSAKHLVNSYSNLMWSCARCNGLKGDLPIPEHAARGFRFIRVDEEDYLAHLEPNGVLLNPITTVGRYTHKVLYLDAHLLRRVRDLRRRALRSTEAVAGGIRYLQNLSMDRLPPAVRVNFVKLRKDLIGRAATQDALVEKALWGFSRSPNLDVDADGPKHVAERRKLLRDLGAPDPTKGLSSGSNG